MSKRFTGFALFFCAVGLASGAAHAGDFAFKYQKYELASQESAAALFARLEARVKSYCSTPGRKPLSQQAVEKECVDDTLEDAVRQIRHPYIDRMYASMSDSAA
ncbi:MAG: UrcA family protein [Pseudomonadota bacterium]